MQDATIVFRGHLGGNNILETFNIFIIILQHAVKAILQCIKRKMLQTRR